ncbi:MAG: thioredoxin [Ahrensia sp.]|nr:thioredoxin [Ahrensia sp.]
MIDRRQFTLLLAASAGAATALPAIAAEIGEDGLHVQPWFMQTFLDLAEDKAEAEAAGKHFAVVFEQRGCPYCKEMHEVNFARPEIADYVSSNFGVLQLNMWGARAVTDFDGEELEERDLARKWNVHFTPTIVFFGPGGDAEVIRMPGYFKPFHFISMFEYVAGGHYAEEGFQRFLQARFDRLEEEGKKPDLW